MTLIVVNGGFTRRNNFEKILESSSSSSGSNKNVLSVKVISCLGLVKCMEGLLR